MQLDRDNYVDQCGVVNNLIDSLKSSYYSSIIHEHSGDQKTRLELNKRLQKKVVQHFPPASSNGVLANNLADFFSEKIEKIHRSLTEKQASVGSTPYLDDVSSMELSELSEVTEDSIMAFACKPMSKSCHLDPIPASVLKGCFNTLIPITVKIVNLSLSTGVMPNSLKMAELFPSLKKHDANHEQYPNFCPISNLPMISKSH